MEIPHDFDLKEDVILFQKLHDLLKDVEDLRKRFIKFREVREIYDDPNPQNLSVTDLIKQIKMIERYRK